MLDFKPNFFKKIYQSLETSSVLMKVDADGEKYFPIWCSKEFSEMIEGTEEEFIKAESNGGLETIHPDDREEVKYLFKHRMTKSGAKNVNIRKKTLKDNWLWLDVHFAFVEEDGEWYAYLSYFDITKIVQSERHAKKLYENVSAELENIANESLVALRLNLTKDLVEDCRGREVHDVDVDGKSISGNFETRLSMFPLERDRKKFVEKFSTEKLLQSYEVGEKKLSDIFFSQRPNGRKCFVEYNVTLSKDPESGDIIAFANERDYNIERVNEIIRNKALVEQYDMITYIVDGDYEVVIGNAENVKGSIFPREMTGSYKQYLDEQVKPALTGTYNDQKNHLAALSLERIEGALAVREPYEVNIVCHIDGELRYKRFIFYLVDQDAKFYLLLKSDTTKLQKIQLMRNAQLKAALDNANQANIAKTAFLSNISHEIRTPMNAIIGLDTIALSEPDLSDRTRDHLEKIGASARHLLSLINDVLDMSRIESGRMNLKNEEFSFGKMLEEINTMIGGQCADKKLNYDCKILGKVDEFYIGDVMKLKQILLNILGNAVKFTPSPGSVTFTVEKTAEFDNRTTLRFVVKDTGIGMDADFVPKIFDVFSQADNTTMNAYGGTGLGMPITKSIVEMMNGKIDVKSEKNVGSEFTVSITFRDSDKTGALAKHIGISVQDLNVLVIDDDPIACEHAKLVMEEVGTSADTATTAKEALDKIKLHTARHKPYNLIFIDWKMPERDGIELTREIRKIIGEESAIIFLTAYNWEEVEEEAKAAGVDRFMAKPLFAYHVMDEFIQAMKQKNIVLTTEKKLADLTGRKILLAEDMLVNAEIMKELLTMREMEVDHAENGQAVVEMFDKSPLNYYDAILMDVRMPIMDGLTATEKIRQLEREDAKTIPIIAMTANAFDEDVERSLQAGMNAHLSKPVEPEHMYQTLQEFIKAD